MRRAPAFLLLLLAACGGARPEPPPVDQTLRNHLAAGRLALEAARHEEAARQYGLALERARARDSAEDIAEAATGRAAALLAQGAARTALEEAEAARRALERRAAPVPATLRLAEATARYRAGDAPGARALLEPWPEGGEAEAAQRAAFLLGLIAAEAGDAEALSRARARLGAPAARGLRADAEELAARAALLAEDGAGAEAAALRALEDRRAALDDRGVTRALALAADAAARQGAREREADYALRAGQAAAARGELREARALLERARRIGGDAAFMRAVQAAHAAPPR
ncbi:hypothetical protein [Rubritepida flocculans]|uniref:hypothetical protein n=1 Tax=Rubritepida flocculans TaxID=182403 RepID=UPI0004136AA1|nr:hypothetical protein [Rubritepida flocculans]